MKAAERRREIIENSVHEISKNNWIYWKGIQIWSHEAEISSCPYYFSVSSPKASIWDFICEERWGGVKIMRWYKIQDISFFLDSRGECWKLCCIKCSGRIRVPVQKERCMFIWNPCTGAHKQTLEMLRTCEYVSSFFVAHIAQSVGCGLLLLWLVDFFPCFHFLFPVVSLSLHCIYFLYRQSQHDLQRTPSNYILENKTKLKEYDCTIYFFMRVYICVF